jgi:hypothetical protein
MTPDYTISEDTPLRLARAAEIAFPDGGMTAKGLRREAERGRLVIERIAGKDFTTLRAIADMRKLCRVAPKDKGSGFNWRDGEPPTAADLESAQARLRAKLREPRPPAGLQAVLDNLKAGPLDVAARMKTAWAERDEKNKARRMSKRERDALRECYEAAAPVALDRHWVRTVMWLVLHKLISVTTDARSGRRLYTITPAGKAEWLRSSLGAPT